MMSDNHAILAGFTKEYIAESGIGPDIHIFAQPEDPLDCVSTVYDADNCEFISLNCWHFTFTEIEESE